MQWSIQDKRLEETYPDLTWGHIEALRIYWREFYDNSQEWKGTELEKIIFEWFKNDEVKRMIEEWNNEDAF